MNRRHETCHTVRTVGIVVLLWASTLATTGCTWLAPPSYRWHVIRQFAEVAVWRENIVTGNTCLDRITPPRGLTAWEVEHACLYETLMKGK